MRSRSILGATLMVFGASCSSNDTTTVTPNPPVVVAAFTGNNQTTTVNATLVTPLTVKVTDAAGAAVAGVTVNWVVTSGGGSVTPATSTTDSNGRATTVFTLGSTVGTQTVNASVATIASPVTFAATGISNTPVIAITLVTSVPTPTGATFDHDTYVRDGLAFASMWNAGMRIYDVGNGMAGGSPANPVLVGSIITSANGVAGGPQVHNSWWFHNPVTGQNKYLFIGQEGSGSIGSSSAGDIHIVDVSNLAAPVEVGFIHIAGAGVHNFWMDEASQVLYAAYYNAGVRALDVRGDLSSCAASAKDAMGRCNLALSGRLLGSGLSAAGTYVWGVDGAAGIHGAARCVRHVDCCGLHARGSNKCLTPGADEGVAEGHPHNAACTHQRIQIRGPPRG